MVVPAQTNIIDVFQSYTNLCREIDLLEIEKSNLESEWEVYHKLMFNNPRGGFNGGLVALPLENVAERLDKIKSKHDLVEKVLDIKKRFKTQAEVILNQFDGIEYKVAYMRFVECKKLEEIAEETSYSLDWIKKVSARISRHLEGTDILNKV
jgi:hypothetical protein